MKITDEMIDAYNKSLREDMASGELPIAEALALANSFEKQGLEENFPIARELRQYVKEKSHGPQ